MDTILKQFIHVLFTCLLLDLPSGHNIVLERHIVVEITYHHSINIIALSWWLVCLINCDM
jgi:hypothetical protein